MQPRVFLTHIDALLDQLEATPGQRQLARSLSLAGALAHLMNCTPRQLLADLRPAIDALDTADAQLLHDATEVRR
jgi:hypothetical protein